MRRVLNLIAVLLIVAAGVGLYQLKYRTQRVQQEVQALQRQMIVDAEAIKVLRTEWTYLSRPERLEELGLRYLALKPPAPTQVIASISEIAAREDMETVVAQVDDFRLVGPQLASGPAQRPTGPTRQPEAAPLPRERTVPAPIPAPAERAAPFIEIKHQVEDDPLAFIKKLHFVSANTERSYD